MWYWNKQVNNYSEWELNCCGDFLLKGSNWDVLPLPYSKNTPWLRLTGSIQRITKYPKGLPLTDSSIALLGWTLTWNLQKRRELWRVIILPWNDDHQFFRDLLNRSVPGYFWQWPKNCWKNRKSRLPVTSFLSQNWARCTYLRSETTENALILIFVAMAIESIQTNPFQHVTK